MTPSGMLDSTREMYVCGYCHLQMTSHRDRSLATPQESPLRGAQRSMFPSLQDPWSMEKMGHKVFGTSSPWRGWATGSLEKICHGVLRLCCPMVYCWVCPLLPSQGFHGHAKQKSNCEVPQDPPRSSRRGGAGDLGRGFDPPMGPHTVLLQAGYPLCCRTAAWRCSLCGLWANHTQRSPGQLHPSFPRDLIKAQLPSILGNSAAHSPACAPSNPQKSPSAEHGAGHTVPLHHYTTRHPLSSWTSAQKFGE